MFPTTLLLLTLFRLALNISSARLILLNGNTRDGGGRRRHSGVRQFCGGRQLHHRRGDLSGTDRDSIRRDQPRRGAHFGSHGAVHPGCSAGQTDVDRFRSERGLIDETEARPRRKNLANEAEFYGAMDGASRFTQRDAVASILITGINIIAGFLIGVLQHGMDLEHAIETYTS